MNIATRSQAPGKSLPAELLVGGRRGFHRLMQNGEVVQQRGMRGLGDTGTCYDTEGGSYPCDSSGNPIGTTPPVTIAPVTITPPGSTPPNYAGLTSIINASSTDLAKILAASNPGTYYKDPSGNVIYSQPPGQGNLPGVYGASGPGAGGQISATGPFGSSLSTSGISSNTILMVALVGLVAVMFMQRGR